MFAIDLSFEPKTGLPIDFTRTTKDNIVYPNLGYSPFPGDQHVVSELDLTGQFEEIIMLSPAEREYGPEPIKLLEEDVRRLKHNAQAFFSKKGAQYPEKFDQGFNDGWKDAQTYGYRRTLSYAEELYPANYVIGYFLGEAAYLAKHVN